MTKLTNNFGKQMKIKFLLFIIMSLIIYSCADDATGWSELSPSDSPTSRYDSCSFYQNDINSFYVIGGLAENKKYNDIWKLDTKTDKWKEITAPTGGISLKIGGRMNYCTFDQDTDSLYLYGINEGGNASPSRILKWEVNNNVLKELATSNIPGTSRGHSFLLLKTGLSEPSLIIFGGEDGGGNKNNDIRVFGLNSKTFKTLEVNGTKPSTRMLHSAVISKDNKMIITGGKATFGLSSDIWSFDFTSKTWTEISSIDENIQTFSTSNTYNKENNSILFYGGSTNNSDFSSDFLEYDITKKSWNKIDSSSKPGKLSGASITITPSNSFYIFGGNSINSKNEVISNNKLWKYNF